MKFHRLAIASICVFAISIPIVSVVKEVMQLMNIFNLTTYSYFLFYQIKNYDK